MRHSLFIATVALVVTGVVTLGFIFARPTSVDEPEPPAVTATCESDADCVRAGCSSQLCVHRERAATAVTSCEFTRESACRAEDVCGCVAGLCAWAHGDAFQSCLDREGEP